MLAKNDASTQYKKYLKLAQNFSDLSVSSTSVEKAQNYRLQAVNVYDRLLQNIDVTSYLLLDSNPPVPENVFVQSHFNKGTLLKMFAEQELADASRLLKQNVLNRNASINISEQHIQLFRKSLDCFVTVLRVRFEDPSSIKQIVSIYTQLCFFSQTDPEVCMKYLKEAIFYAPENETLHYNLGLIFQRTNMLESAVIHYKLSLELCTLRNRQKKLTSTEKEDLRKLQINNYNGISCVFRAVKNWPESLHYLRKAEAIDPDDPDVQNQLGVVYTEMRRTDLAERAYNHAIKNYKKTFVSNDPEFLLSELYLNLGHMHSYNGDNEASIASYNKSLQICPKFSLPFQNKIMNLSYLFDQLADKTYILKQHQLVNKLYTKGNGRFKFGDVYFRSDKINIGIISGDFVDHPVSFFISTFLKEFDPSKYNVTCYSECIIDTGLFQENLQFKFIKNMSAEDAATLIFEDNVHILLDLAGHTAFNRLDVFAMKPCPVQVTYVGYPYSTGLLEMDYRITDSVCDHPTVSQPFYTEKLVFLDNCFLCYDPSQIQRQARNDTLPAKHLGPQPFLTNKDASSSRPFLTIGCFNRVNKITTGVLKLFNDILKAEKQVRFMFKTKALINKNVQQKFLNNFDDDVRDRIIIENCTILHEDHLLEYNKVDIAIDTFPYSGTTTSCEALYMGVPVFTLYDETYYFHAQNVTASILKNTHKDLEYFITRTPEEMLSKVHELLNDKDEAFWTNLKPRVRDMFLEGNVCNKRLYMENLSKMFASMVEGAKMST